MSFLSCIRTFHPFLSSTSQSAKFEILVKGLFSNKLLYEGSLSGSELNNLVTNKKETCSVSSTSILKDSKGEATSTVLQYKVDFSPASERPVTKRVKSAAFSALSRSPSKELQDSVGPYFQLFNAEEIPFFVDMRTGAASWTLPDFTPMNKISFISHINTSDENSSLYYEEVQSGEVSWELPSSADVMSPEACIVATKLIRLNNKQLARELNTPYSLEVTEAQEDVLAAYLVSLPTTVDDKGNVGSSPGNKKEPPKVEEKESKLERESPEEPRRSTLSSLFGEADATSTKSESYIQLFNAEGMPFFVNMMSGERHEREACWTLPERAQLSDVKVIAHLSEEKENSGALYYEEVQSGEVSWELPSSADVMSPEARIVATKLIRMSTAALSKVMRAPYAEERTSQQMDALNDYLSDLPDHDESKHVDTAATAVTTVAEEIPPPPTPTPPLPRLWKNH